MPELHELAVWLLVSIIAITFHEAAHGWVADRCGDPTARLQGRVSFNPVRHIDSFGTIILPVLMKLSGLPFVFGWAKPVPVNFRNLRHRRRDSALVAFAGPGINLLLAVLALAALGIWVALAGGLKEVPGIAQEVFVFGAILNLAFAFFNLLPIPPLDGGVVLAAFLPDRYAIYLARIERHGLVIIVGGLLLLPWLLGKLGLSFDPVEWLVLVPVRVVGNGLANIVGLPDLL